MRYSCALLCNFSGHFQSQKRRNENRRNRRILVRYWRIYCMRVVFAGFALSAVAFAAPAPKAKEVTFYKDVLPVLENNCQGCHRPGEPGPMSFMSYDSTRPWAKAIKQAVATKKMPP